MGCTWNMLENGTLPSGNFCYMAIAKRPIEFDDLL